MSTNPKIHSPERMREYDREMLRSTFVSIFWAAISERRKRAKFTLQSLADKLGVDKSVVSRWFSGDRPNWETDTIADIAGALDLDLEITARERSHPAVTLTASGSQISTVVQANQVTIERRAETNPAPTPVPIVTAVTVPVVTDSGPLISIEAA